ncbi:helix-turn-helix domain-containing protein [Bacillus coahuilensis]|nr:hypothetical protein [Bacillus coahuilensis]
MTELGSRLKEAREAKGLSLEDVQEINKNYKKDIFKELKKVIIV